MDVKALLFLLGALLINLTLGTFYSIGNVNQYLVSYMRDHNSPTLTLEQGTYITSAYLLGQGLFLIVGAFIEQKFDSRAACVLGCIIHSASTFATMWAIDINFLTVILIYGFGCGAGCGSSYISSIIAVQKWFPNNKGLCTGIIVGAFGFGGLVFTPLQTLLMNPDNTLPDIQGYFDKSIQSRLPSLFLYMGITFSLIQLIGCILAAPAPESNHDDPAPSSPQATNTTIVDEFLPNIKNFWSVFNYEIFYVIGIMMMLVASGVTFVNSLGKTTYGTYIRDDRFLSTVVAIAAVANALGRVFWGFLIDRFAFSTCYTTKVIFFAMLISLFPFEFILTSRVLYLTWMLGLYFGFSGIFVLFPVFIDQVFGSKYNGLIYGFDYVVLAVGSIITSLVIQLTIQPILVSVKTPEEKLTARIIPCTTIAVLYIASLVLYFVLIPVKKLEAAIKRKIESESMRKKASLFNRHDLFPLDRGTLAEKTAKVNSGIRKENSLGSIVKIRDTFDDNRIKLYK